MRPSSRVFLAVVTAASAAAGLAPAVTPTSAAPARRDAWFTSWASSQQSRSGTRLTDQTVRMVTHLSQGGNAVRIRVQNQFGDAPLRIDAAAVGLSTGVDAAVVAGSSRPLTFAGRPSVSVGAGADAWSDPVTLTTSAQQDLAVSLYLPGPVNPGEHASAFRTNWFTPAGSGNHAGDPGAAAYTQTTGSTWIVSAVDVRSADIRGTIVGFGSSVVDGTGSTDCGPGCTRTGNNERWSDVLARRGTAELPPARQLAVANAGIGGTISARSCPGEPDGVKGLEAEARLGRDVLALHGVTGVIYYYGTNDLANGCTSEQILDSWKAVFARLHAAGVKVYVVPTTARPGYTDQMNRYRWELGTYAKNRNNCGGDCDGVLDFDQVIKDPVRSGSINPGYDVGDGIHVNIAAQRAEGEFINLEMLAAPGR
jgi:lysophospholipase L1-like esterase